MQVDAVEIEPTHLGALACPVDRRLALRLRRAVAFQQLEAPPTMLLVGLAVQPEMLDGVLIELVLFSQSGEHGTVKQWRLGLRANEACRHTCNPPFLFAH